jgi:hypothetical protein
MSDVMSLFLFFILVNLFIELVPVDVHFVSLFIAVEILFKLNLSCMYVVYVSRRYSLRQRS